MTSPLRPRCAAKFSTRLLRHSTGRAIELGSRTRGRLLAEAYPYGAVLMRREVREVEMKSHMALVQRIKAEQINLKALPDADPDQKNAKLTAIAQTETTLTQLEATAPIGRVVVHIQPDIERWRNTAADVALRDGDVLLIPKKANYVMVSGQVYQPDRNQLPAGQERAVVSEPGRRVDPDGGQAGRLRDPGRWIGDRLEEQLRMVGWAIH